MARKRGSPSAQPPTEKVEIQRVGIVEDDALQREILRQFLERLGFSVFVFEDAESCLRDYEKRDYEKTDLDLLFVDQHLPGLTGLKLSKKLHRAAIPIVMVTSEESSEEIEKMGEAEWIVEYLSKPVDFHDLRKKLSFIRGKVRGQRQRRKDRLDIETAKSFLKEKNSWNEQTAYAKMKAEASKRHISLPEYAREVNRTFLGH